MGRTIIENWILISEKFPEDGRFVIANIVEGNHIYAEYLAYESNEDQWRYHNGNLLEEGKKVTAWQPGPGNLING